MHDDVFCVFIIVACLIVLLTPGAGQIVVGLFAFGIASVALAFPDNTGARDQAPPDRKHTARS